MSLRDELAESVAKKRVLAAAERRVFLALRDLSDLEDAIGSNPDRRCSLCGQPRRRQEVAE